MELVRIQKNERAINDKDKEDDDEQKIKKNDLNKYGIWKQKIEFRHVLSQKSYQISFVL